MNRLNHLKSTLKTNIANNVGYGNVEFILLDYNSTDGLEEYVNRNFRNEIKKQKLVYYKTNTPSFFDSTHSRNVAFKLASGDIICNLDADNFTGHGFADFINSTFNKIPDVFLAVDSPFDAVGRICVRKEDFLKVNGYNEELYHYGSEDVDLINRLLKLNLKKIKIEDVSFLKTIPHDIKDRIRNEYIFKILKHVFLNYRNHLSTEILILLDNKKYIRGNIFRYPVEKGGHKIGYPNEHVFINDLNWEHGFWEFCESNTIINLKGSIEENLYYDQTDKAYVDGTKEYHEITDPDLIVNLVYLYSRIANTLVLKKSESQAVINQLGFGKSTVYKNFNYEQPFITE